MQSRHQQEIDMKALLVGITALVFIPSLAAAQQGAAKDTGPGPAHVLTRAEFDALLAHPEKLLIVDVRRPDELTSIGGFGVYLSVQPGDVEKSLALIPRDRTIVTVSNHAARATRVAQILAAHDFHVAGAIGAENYAQQGGTLIKISPPPANASPPASTTH
jgi:rhodanese-related sulfurtransferase